MSTCLEYVSIEQIYPQQSNLPHISSVNDKTKCCKIILAAIDKTDNLARFTDYFLDYFLFFLQNYLVILIPNVDVYDHGTGHLLE